MKMGGITGVTLSVKLPGLSMGLATVIIKAGGTIEPTDHVVEVARPNSNQ